jgi:hypothetical protein
MRLHEHDPCPGCGEPLVLRQMRTIFTLFRRRHLLLCRVCDFTAVARRAAVSIRVKNGWNELFRFAFPARNREGAVEGAIMSTNFSIHDQTGHYLVLAQEARMSATRSTGTEHSALIDIAESWEKLAREREGIPPSHLTARQSLATAVIQRVKARVHRAWKDGLDPFVISNSWDRLVAALTRPHVLLSATSKFRQPLVFALVIMAGVSATPWFTAERDSPASEVDSPLRMDALAHWKSEVKSVRNLETIARVDLQPPVVLTLIVPLSLQAVQISDPKVAGKSSPVTGKRGVSRRPTTRRRATEPAPDTAPKPTDDPRALAS